MYPPLLGKFIVPTEGHWSMPKEGWVTGVKYQPEPPIVVRGAMNPWADERQRQVFKAEELAWVEILKLQATYRAVYAKAQALIRQMNQLVAELEGLTGKKAGMFTLSNIATLAATASGNPYIMAAMFLKMFVFDSIFGNKKKKKIEALVERLKGLQAQVMVFYQEMNRIEQEVGGYIQTGEALRGMQQTKMTAELQQSEGAYQKRQSLDRLRAGILRERNRQVALMPRTQGGTNEL